MQQANDIFEKFKAKEISTEEALNLLGPLFVGASHKEKVFLLNTSNKILDYEFPETVVNSELDEAFWRSTHREDSDG